MAKATIESIELRAAVVEQRDALESILGRYGAVNPRLFGSVARGDATADSDLDILVDLLPGRGNELLRVVSSDRLPAILALTTDYSAGSSAHYSLLG